LDDTVHNHGERGEEVGAVDFGVEEDFGSEESLVSDVDGDLTAIGVRHNVLGESASVAVVLPKLLDNIGAHITILLLDLLGRLER
jgi:hypothetical protein